jgi:hypothetical protein
MEILTGSPSTSTVSCPQVQDARRVSTSGRYRVAESRAGFEHEDWAPALLRLPKGTASLDHGGPEPGEDGVTWCLLRHWLLGERD